MFADQNAETLWVISADLDIGMLQTDAITVSELAADNSYELWVLPHWPGLLGTPCRERLIL